MRKAELLRISRRISTTRVRVVVGVAVVAAITPATTAATTRAAKRIADATPNTTTTLRRRWLNGGVAVGDVERGHLTNLREQRQHRNSHIAAVGRNHACAGEVGTRRQCDNNRLV